MTSLFWEAGLLERFRAMPAEEPTFVPPPAISQQFHPPANQLDETLDPTAIQREDKLILEWSPIDNATGPFAYAVKVTCGPELEQFYGEFLETDNKLEIVQGKEYGRFYFEIKRFPWAETLRIFPVIQACPLITRSFPAPRP